MYVTRKDRVLKLLDLYKDEIKNGRLERVYNELEGHFHEIARQKSNKHTKLHRPKSLNHGKRFDFIYMMQERLSGHPYYIDFETSGLVVTEIIAVLRKMIGSEDFTIFCQELLSISKVAHTEENNIESTLLTENLNI